MRMALDRHLRRVSWPFKDWLRKSLVGSIGDLTICLGRLGCLCIEYQLYLRRQSKNCDNHTFWNEISLVMVILCCEGVGNGQRKRWLESQQFSIYSLQIWHRFAVIQCWKAFRTYHTVKFFLSLLLNFWMEGHLAEKRPRWRDCLHNIVSLGCSNTLIFDTPYLKQLVGRNCMWVSDFWWHRVLLTTIYSVCNILDYIFFFLRSTDRVLLLIEVGYQWRDSCSICLVSVSISLFAHLITRRV